jgi:hypothetical protein
MATYADVFQQLEQMRQERELAHQGVDQQHDKQVQAADAQWRGDRRIEEGKGEGELTQANLDKIDARHTDQVATIETDRAQSHQSVDQRYDPQIASKEKELQDIRQDKAASEGVTLTEPPPPPPPPPVQSQTYEVSADFATRPQWGAGGPTPLSLQQTNAAQEQADLQRAEAPRERLETHQGAAEISKAGIEDITPHKLQSEVGIADKPAGHIDHNVGHVDAIAAAALAAGALGSLAYQKVSEYLGSSDKGAQVEVQPPPPPPPPPPPEVPSNEQKL